MKRKLTKEVQRILNIHRGVVVPVGNRIEDRAVGEPRTNRHPEFLQETMFQEHGTRVLITNPAADQYLNDGKEEEEINDNLKRKYKQWIDNES